MPCFTRHAQVGSWHVGNETLGNAAEDSHVDVVHLPDDLRILVDVEVEGAVRGELGVLEGVETLLERDTLEARHPGRRIVRQTPTIADLLDAPVGNDCRAEPTFEVGLAARIGVFRDHDVVYVGPADFTVNDSSTVSSIDELLRLL
jgi:predicted methyltransferase MtxX (methanogen marker protein 4)